MVHPICHISASREMIEIPLALARGGSESLEVAIDRLREARARPKPRDRILDAGIALEALLVPCSIQGEISFRFSLNYASLGKTPRERHNRRKTASTIYNYRSKVAHGETKDEEIITETKNGKIKKTVPFREAAEVVLTAATEVVLKGILDPKFEFWDHAFWYKQLLGEPDSDSGDESD